MCSPVLGLGLSLAQGVFGYMQAGAEVKAHNQQARQNAANAVVAMTDQYTALSNRTIQEREAAIQKKTEQQIEVMQASSTAEAAAGEGGVAGNSVSAILGDYYAKSGRFNDAVDANYQMQREFLTAEGRAAHSEAQNRINSMPLKPKPSPFMIFSNLSLPSFG